MILIILLLILINISNLLLICIFLKFNIQLLQQINLHILIINI